MITQVRKRDGRVVDFSRANIESAIRKAARATNTNIDIITVSNYVIKSLEEKFKDRIPSVEEVQDSVEKTLVHFDYSDTAKAYILYRQKRSNEREGKYLIDVLSLVDDYIEQKDWRVKENANASYSVSGLTFHIAGSVIANYSLNKYPHHIGHAHKSGDIHIHDLSFGLICGYCAGWDLEKLFLEGINGIPGKITSNPANHLTSATWQMINFIGTLQNEWAGAQAFNSVDTLLAPFIRKDQLTYKQVRQAMQGLIFNLNVPSRWANQCVSEDTEGLTENGWKRFNQIKDEKIATFNIQTGKIEYLKPNRIAIYDYNGPLVRLKNRTQEQLVTPNHKVVREKFNSDKFEFIEAQELLSYKSPINVPLSGETTNKKEIDENLVKLIAWLVSEGCFSGDRGRLLICQSVKNTKNNNEIRTILKNLDLGWDEQKQVGGFSKTPIITYRLNQESSRKIRKTIDSKEIPPIIKELSKEQIKLFIDTYVKGDGWIEHDRIRIATKSESIRDSLQELCVLCGYGSTTRLRTENYVWNINIIRNPIASITKIDTIKYNGKVWCPTTKNGTFIARRNGKVFITGNTPFSNFTFDWTIPEDRKEDIPVIGGRPMDFTYGDLQEESLMINKAFMEVLSSGDAKGSTFTFPIPTINITKEFDWNGPMTDELFSLTAKYGPYYFANFVNSELDPKDIRSMCCRLSLRLDELRNKMGGLFGAGSQTGSLAVTTINLPRLGYLSKDDTEFFERLDKLLDIAKESMEIKRKVISRHLELGLMPYTRRYLGHFNGHFSTIGIIGMNECLVNYMGSGIWDKESYNFGIGIMDHIRSKLIEIQQETGNLYNLEATPAEGTTRRLAALDKRHYPDIIVANEQNWKEQKVAPYYSNSIHLPVGFTNDIFESLDLEEEFLTKFTGGCVKHIYLGERLPNAESARNLVKKICSKYRVPYISITPQFSVCPNHGYINGVHETCPKEV